jgi:hypothetical protein
MMDKSALDGENRRLLGNGGPPRQTNAAGNIQFERWRIILSRGVGHPVRSGFNVEEKKA